MTQQRFAPMVRLTAALFALLLLSAAVPANNKSGDTYQLGVITFPEAPSVEQIEMLEASGVRLGDYLGHGSYYINLDAAGRLALPASVQLRAAEPTDKYRLIDSILLKHPKSDIVTLRGYFAEGSDFVATRSFVKANGGNIDAQDWDYGTTSVLITLPVGSIEKIAASDSLLAIAPELPLKIHNATSAERSHVDLARDEFGLTGAGVNVAIVDGGEVNVDHPDFGGRVKLAETSSVSTHATHVTGTALGSGAENSSARGMAYEANGYSYNFNDNLSKFYRADDDYGARVINNSWGTTIGWDFNNQMNRWEFWLEQFYFGAYISVTQNIDKYIYDRGVVVVFSAGNDRNDAGPTDGHYWRYLGNDEYEEVTNDPDQAPPDGPYRTTDVFSSAKNIITVGATDSKDAMSNFSSWGPTADGRIKPDVVAKGVFTVSTSTGTSYAFLSGTSMAAPVVTGSMALLIEQFRNTQNRTPTPHELKGVAVTTARDLGNAGPDYSFGFGLLDVQKAAELIARDEDENTILTDSIRKFKKAKRNIPRYFRFSLPSGVDNIRVALVWTDPEGPAAQTFADIIGRQSPVLMNDLDLRLYWIKERKRKDKAIEYEPYVLDPDNPSLTAKRGDNRLDNVEMVEIKNPRKGDWYIEVSAGTFKDGSNQDFAIIVFADEALQSPVEAADQPEALQN